LYLECHSSDQHDVHLLVFQGRYARLQGTAIRKRKRNEKFTDEQWDQVYQAMNLTKDQQAQLAGLSWKQLNQQSRENDDIKVLKEGVLRATDCYNNILREILQGNSSNQLGKSSNNTDDNSEVFADLPTIFRVEGEEDNCFYIYMALAQVAEEFAMRIPAKYTTDRTWLQSGDESTMNFKIALTRCCVLQHATLSGQPVTKVRLEPRTGRRHQLRVHTAFLGHPIVGDQTYEGNGDGKGGHQENLSHRMCLHALSLGFPLPPTQIPGNTNGKVNEGRDIENEKLFIAASDPFQISHDGTLNVSIM